MTFFKLVVLALSQIFLFQTFYYVKEFPPGYLVEKALMPLAGMAVAALVFLPHQRHDRRLANAGWLTIYFAAYFMFTGCLAAYLFYGQSLQLTITSQAKVLPFFYFFLAYYVAYVTKATDKGLFYSIIVPGLILAVFYIIAAKTVDVAKYHEYGSNVFKNDAKGYRLVFPSALVITAYFAYMHYARRKRSILVYAALLTIAYFLVFELKQRVELLSVMVATVSALVGRRWSGLINICFGFLCAAMVTIAMIPSPLSRYWRGVGDDTSWIARRLQLDYVFRLWYETPLSIPLGVGKMSEVSDYGYRELLGFYFTTSDLGWIGMVHEYGVVGTIVLIAMVVVLYRAVPHDYELNSFYAGVVANSFRSYILMTLFLSVIAPRFVYNSGVFFTMFAFSVYLRQRYGGPRWIPVDEVVGESEREELLEYQT